MAASQQQQQQQQQQRVMVAIDESECSNYALEWTLRNLKPTFSPPLLILTVQPIAPLAYLPAASAVSPLGPALVAPELLNSVREHQKQLARALVDKAKSVCEEHGVVVEALVEVGDPKETICEIAEKVNVDLLILGNHSRGPVERIFLGSVSNYCVHHAKCPVLVVKKQD